MPFGLIPFILLVIPVLEIAVFILIGGEIGILATLGMILFTAILGSILLRVQGFATLNRIQAQTANNQVPGRELVNGVMILVAGVLLLTPGFVTDSIGFLLFFPPFRQFLWSTIASRVVVKTHSTFTNYQSGQASPQRDDGVVDLDPSEFSEKPNPDSPWHQNDKD
jgi:UPF0716 protein FxsA